AADPGGARGRRTSAGESAGKAANTGSAAAGSGVPVYARPRDGNDPVGTAVPRGTTPRPPGGGVGIYVPGGYYGPYGYGYGYFDPWAYGAGGFGVYGGFFDPRVARPLPQPPSPASTTPAP